MKNASIFTALVLILIILTACSGISNYNPTRPSAESSTAAEKFPIEIFREQYFTIIQEDYFTYSYRIYNSAGEIVQEENTGSRIPEISMLSEEIVEISVGYGTGLMLQCYYNAEENIFSDTFSYVIANTNQLIAYIDIPSVSAIEARKIVIQNIFNKGIYYQEIYLDLARVETPVINAEFSKDGLEMIITYLKGEEQIETTEIFSVTGG